VTNPSDNTGQKQDTRFQPGQSGNPAGRPKGARNKLNENFINAFAQDFEQHGAAVIEKVRTERPQDYLKVAAALLPKQMEVRTARTGSMSELSDAELMNILLRASLDEIVEVLLVHRGHPPLTSAQRHLLQQWEQEIGPEPRLKSISGDWVSIIRESSRAS
jgi:hypothetical protein